MSEHRERAWRRPGRAGRPGQPTRRRAPSVARPLAVGLTALAAAACGGDRLGDPSDPASTEPAPDSFTVALRTSEGEVVMRLHRDWSPAGVDRVYHLAGTGFWDGARIYRVNPRYAQFGYSGRPALDSLWIAAGLADEPARASNVRGSVSFARGGPNSRSAILFINRDDNSDLDEMPWRGVPGFPPVGRIERGMEVVDALYDGYGDDPLEWEDSIAALGNAFLDRRYPELDSIIDVRIVEQWR